MVLFPVPVEPGQLEPQDCLASTEFLDYQTPTVQGYLKSQLGITPKELTWQTGSDPEAQIDLAIRLYVLARDGWRYNPYTLEKPRSKFKISHILTLKQSYCIPKAMLLAGFARACGIPSRLGFGDVKNHLSSPRLVDYLRTDVFAYHGYTELFLNGKWVQATPAFDTRLCKYMGVAVLEFNGRNNSLFQEYNQKGESFMTYIRYHGVSADLPYEWLMEGFASAYPHIYSEGMIDGDLTQEI